MQSQMHLKLEKHLAESLFLMEEIYWTKEINRFWP